MMAYCCNVLSSRTFTSCGAKLNNRVLSEADSLHSHRGIRKVLISAVKKEKQTRGEKVVMENLSQVESRWYNSCLSRG